MWLCSSLINLFRHYHLIVRILTPQARKFSFGIIVTNDCVSVWVLSKISSEVHTNNSTCFSKYSFLSDFWLWCGNRMCVILRPRNVYFTKSLSLLWILEMEENYETFTQIYAAVIPPWVHLFADYSPYDVIWIGRVDIINYDGFYFNMNCY